MSQYPQPPVLPPVPGASLPPSLPPEPQKQERSASKAVFAAGVAAGVAAVLCVIFGAKLFDGGFVGGSQRDLGALASIVCRPLYTSASQDRSLPASEELAIMRTRLQQAKQIAARSPELAPVAASFASTLETAIPLAEGMPDGSALVRNGSEAWRAGRDGNDLQLLMSLLGAGIEIVKITEHIEKFSDLHARVVADRLRLADIAARRAAGKANAIAFDARFEESGLFRQVKSDTLTVTNRSAMPLSNVILEVQITGSSGEAFTNAFFAPTWDPGQALLAVCRSEPPGRETVHDVTRVRCRVIASEGMSGVADIKNR